MKTRKRLAYIGLIASLMGCDALGGGPSAMDGGVAFEFSSAEDSEGNCQPERAGVADVGTTKLFAMRGEATYTMPGGDTNIPFQAIFRYPNNRGFAEDKAVTSLNYPGPCSDLAVKIRIDYCEYDVPQGLEERPCPEIDIGGADEFSSIQVQRSDLENADS